MGCSRPHRLAEVALSAQQWHPRQHMGLVHTEGGRAWEAECEEGTDTECVQLTQGFVNWLLVNQLWPGSWERERLHLYTNQVWRWAHCGVDFFVSFFPPSKTLWMKEAVWWFPLRHHSLVGLSWVSTLQSLNKTVYGAPHLLRYWTAAWRIPALDSE